MWLPWRRRRRNVPGSQPLPPPEPGDDVGMPKHGHVDVRCRWCNTTKWRLHGVYLCPFCDHPKPREENR